MGRRSAKHTNGRQSMVDARGLLRALDEYRLARDLSWQTVAALCRCHYTTLTKSIGSASRPGTWLLRDTLYHRILRNAGRKIGYLGAQHG